MRYLVTGATGFLGAHLVASLEARGHEVTPFSRSHGGDVLDAGAVRAAAAGCDGAFHCAGKVSRKPGDAEALYRVHVDGTKNVLDACADAGVRRVVIASTSGTVAVSDSPEHVATEDDEAPIGIVSRWPYYRAKLFAERAALARSREGLDVVSVNPSLLLGPGDVHGSSTEDVRLFLEGAIPAVPAGGLSFVDARDAAEAMALAMARGRGGERYLVGACNLTMRDFFGRLARVSGVPAPWLPMPRSREVARLGARMMERLAARVGVPARVDSVSVEMAQCFWYLDASKAERELGWSARDPGDTLHDTVEDLRARGVVWPREHGETASESPLASS
ncbi:MAG TPA: NAD-dependent epimerase/dehydratase family protein [Polyangiaceae bacterium]|nr:NAD-dependent epimerase/dehydratase family protein [Polyangiaceae bacterium]